MSSRCTGVLHIDTVVMEEYYGLVKETSQVQTKVETESLRRECIYMNVLSGDGLSKGKEGWDWLTVTGGWDKEEIHYPWLNLCKVSLVFHCCRFYLMFENSNSQLHFDLYKVLCLKQRSVCIGIGTELGAGYCLGHFLNV